ncbi:hypothetical protein FB45DRAFT_1039981 [Roridomyces roridus]|uniref:Acetoin reductase family protein n=1 Tax=Roridomyces roridus TaxID=1738132 RepID=A0AAD7F830_9AGAR|nr:hypothetical protein FB45DRAFT_1039981 [Roridomyces roridus]
MSSNSNRVAIVTGAGKGSGKIIALRLADDGLDVAVNDVQSNAFALAELVGEIKAKGRSSSAHVADVSVDGEVKGMVDEVVRTYGKVDAMVANAGVASYDPIVELDVQEWDRIMNINARGTFLCYKYAGLQMMKQGTGGRIVGASSVLEGKACLSAYTASKFAIRGLTQSAALEFGPHNGITVNAYGPGAVDTEMMGAEYPEVPREEIINRFKKMSPLGLVGMPDDIASLVSFLVSKDSQFITGQTISINGGTFFD